MSWTRTNPGAGDPWGIRSQASIRQTGADNLRTTTLTNLQTAVTDAASATWTAQAATAFAASAEGLIPDVQVIITGLETDAGALNQYAAMVEQIQDQARAVQRQQEDAQRDLARLLFTSFGDIAETTSPRSEPDPNALERARVAEALRETRSTLTQVEVRWDELALQRRAADDACVATLTSVGSRGNLAGLGTQQLSYLSTTGLLQKLGGLSATEITILVQNNPGLAEKFRNSPPDTAGVEVWWSGLDAASQAALIVALPIVIGNLEGVPYGSRVLANKHNISTGIATLETEIVDLEKTVEANKDGSGTRGGGSGLARREAQEKIDALREQISYYRRLRDEEIEFSDPATGLPVAVTGHNILVFDHAHDAIAEYSGLLDPVTGNVPAGVDYVGLYVPGTNTTLGNFDGEVNRSEWFLNQPTDKGSVGMITWKGGPFPQDLEALSGAMADGLGQKLAHFGQGLELATSAEVTGMGYSAGGSIMGSAERAGLALDRSVQLSSAGMGFGVRDLAEYPVTADVPHYSLMAPNDPLVLFQGAEAGDLGHGGSPLTTDGFIRLETGYRENGQVSSGQLEGHLNVWDRKGTVRRQLYNVLVGGQVELYAEPEVVVIPGTNQSYATNPIMEPGYEPTLVDVEGGEQ
ncbi:MULTISPECIES: hypothetical protein [Cryobacterium]|uniref:hypothetical protein n=1 Tax=Cryobacterium TaxID=69578 RepID=UPI000CD48156|nr:MULTISPECIES: hypothetical protein [Cryobacterium]POH64601.1 hypothetical protein C3B60_14335 [Cryobacterium zongtaii]TFC46312.1 hypothetical protein E3O57_07235 [Cryobacterium sp. TMN-39-2]